MVQVLVADLDEDAAAGGEEIAGEKEPIAQIGQVGMQAEFPGIPIGLDHFRFARHVLVVIMGDIALADEGLEVAAELHAVGRVHVDHLHLATEPFIVQERVHDHKRITQHHAIRPVVLILIGLQYLIGDGMLRVTKQSEHILLLVGLVPRQRFDNGFGGEPLMNEERQGRHVERQPFSFPGPIQERFAQTPEFGRGSLGFFQTLGVEDLLDESLPLLAGWILGIPIKRRREG